MKQKEDGIVLAVKLVKGVEIYKQLEDPTYTQRIQYWDKQAEYASKVLEKGWEPTPKQAEIFQSNFERLSQLVLKLSGSLD